VRLEGHLEATTDSSTSSDKLNLKRGIYDVLCKNVLLCTDGGEVVGVGGWGRGGGGRHTQRIMMCALLSRDGLEDLQFGFHVFTDTKVDQPIKPAKERERSHSTEIESGDCHILTCLV